MQRANLRIPCLALVPLLPVLAGSHPLAFEPNQGQAPVAVRYVARTAEYSVWLSSDAIAVQSSSAGAFRMRFPGASRRVRLEALDRLAGTSNYILGRDPRNWHTGIPTFAGVRYQGLYPGVDLIVHTGQGSQLEYDFRIAPGGDPSVLRLMFDGSRPLRLDARGNLVLAGTDGWVQHKPGIFQAGASIDGGYKLLAEGQVGFSVGRYDHRKPLVIDPVISYATYLGGSNDGAIGSVAVDGQGNAYVAGSVGVNAVVSKLNPAGTALVYSTVIGSEGESLATGIAVDSGGNAYVAGVAGSQSFPVTPGALRTTIATGGDGFLAKLDPTGAKLLYSTFLGGAWPNPAFNAVSIAISRLGDLYVAGTTLSADFPILNALQPNPGGGVCGENESPPGIIPIPCPDAFVMHWRSSDMTLLFSTYLGGSNSDAASAVATDAAGNAYVTGSTNSADFPVTNAFQPTFGGGICRGPFTSPPCPDAFVTKISAGGTLVYSTFLGGNATDGGSGIAVDSAGEANVSGWTNSTNFPVVNALQSTPGNSFIAKFNAEGNGLLFSTYFDGEIGPVALDPMGNAFVLGSGSELTASSPNVIAPSLINPCAGGAISVTPLLAEFRPDGSLAYAGLLGGTGDTDIAVGIAVDSSGNVYAAGNTNSGDFPVTAGAYQTVFGSGFLAKIDPTGSPAAGITLAPACIVNAASYLNWQLQSGAQTSPLSGYVAPGEIITIFGNDLGPVNGAGAVLDAQGRLPSSLGGVILTFDGIPAPLLYVQANQINAIVPFEVAGKASTMVQLRYNGASSNAAMLLVADAVPGIFTAEIDGVIQIAAFDQDGTLNSVDNPADEGSIISMWATGLGLLNQSYADGQIVTGTASLVAPPAIGVNGYVAQIQYIGQAPGLVAGAIQINLVVPKGVPSGPNQVLFNNMNGYPYGSIYIR
jgi:uncharacterized protein (TIGR03437 family)